MSYRHTVEIPLAKEQVFAFFHDLERWFRLSPQWNVLSIEAEEPLREGSRFSLKVEYDRSETEVAYQGVVTEFKPGTLLTVRLEGSIPREMTVEVMDARSTALLKYREPREIPPSSHEQRELELWMNSVANYVQISHRKSSFSRLWKWFLDRYWIKMSPSGRRTVFFVVCAEGLSLIFFLLILVWILVFKKI